MTTTRRSFSIRGAVDMASVRHATHCSRDHLVVPVVALVGNIVLRPLGSKGLEFVPAEVASHLPAAWNGRPVLTNHPSFDSDGGGSANTPTVLEQYQIGDVFNTQWDGERLRMEAWIDTEHAATMGGDAQSVVTRCEAGEAVEVSVGCYVELSDEGGVAPNGQKYDYKWVGLVSDHLAMLPEGTRGACSVDAGCGAPRLNKEDDDMTKAVKKESRLSAFGQRVLEAMRLRAAEGSATGESVSELWAELSAALYNIEAGFMGVRDVFVDTSTVVYEVYREEKYSTFQRTYEKGDEGYTLSESAEEVALVVEYKPLEVEPPVITTQLRAASCPCSGDHAETTKKEVTNMTVKELAGRLIATKRLAFTEEDRAVLETFTEARLEALLADAEKVETPVTTPVVPEVKTDVVPATETKTLAEQEKEWIAGAPERIQRILADHQRQEDEKRATWIAALSKSQKAYTVAELQAMPTCGLEKLATVLAVKPKVDFAGLSTTKTPEGSVKAPPRPFDLALAAAKKQ